MRGACDLVEIVLDLPTPISTNKIWRTGRGRTYRSKEYVAWRTGRPDGDGRQRYPSKRKINGPFEVEILLSTVGRKDRDGDNFCKATLDWLHSRDLIRNDTDCRCGSWKWVSPEEPRRVNG